MRKLRESGERNEANTLMAQITDAEACGRLQVSQIPKHPLQQVLKDIARFVKAKTVEIPLMNLLAFTKKYTAEATAYGKPLDAWLKCVQLELPATADFDCEAPEFAPLLSKVSPEELPSGSSPKKQASSGQPTAVSDADDDDEALDKDATLRDVMRFYHEAMFNDVFLTLVANIGDATAKGHLMEILSKYLAWFVAADDKDEEMDERCMKLVEPVVRAYRGLYSVLSPIPLKYRSSAQDVAFVFPDGRQEAKQACDMCTAFGTGLMEEVNNPKATVWSQLLALYRNRVAAEAANGPGVESCRLSLADALKLLKESPPTPGQALVADLADRCAAAMSKYAKSVEKWRESLRRGACAEIDELATQVVGLTARHELTRGTEADVKKLTPLKELADLCGDRATSVELQEALFEKSTLTHQDRIQRAALNDFDKISDLSELLAAYRQCKHDANLTPDLKSHLLDARDLMLVFMCKSCISENHDNGKVQELLKPGLDLMRHYEEDVELRTDQADVAESDLGNVRGVMAMCVLILELRTKVAQRLAASPKDSTVAFQELLTAHLAVRRHIEAKKHTGLSPGIQNAMGPICDFYNSMSVNGTTIRDYLKEEVARHIHATLADLEKSTNALAPVARGSTEGKEWHEGFPVAGTRKEHLVFINDSLMAIDQKVLEAKGVALTQVQRSLEIHAFFTKGQPANIRTSGPDA